jgi:hypothetical protein
MNTQQVFDEVLKHLWQQNESARSGDDCVYFDEETGMKCAIGCLIPSEYYSSDMEGHGIVGVLELFPNLKEIPAIRAIAEHPAPNCEFGWYLQSLHDNLALVHPDDFRTYLRSAANTLADRYGLTVNLPTEE